MSDPSVNGPPQRPGKADENPQAWVGLTSLGFEFLAAVLLLGALGWWLDRICGTRPWLMLVGGLLGFGVGMRLLLTAAKRAFANKK